MISVSINKNRNDEYVSFSCKGHAGYSSNGKDIVCAAVSMLVINTINSIETLTSCKFNQEQDDSCGFVRITFIDPVTDDVKLLLDSLVLGITDIIKNYGKKYVTLSIKEV